MATRLGLEHAGHPSAFYTWTREEQTRVLALDQILNPSRWPQPKRKTFRASDPDTLMDGPQVVTTPEARAFWRGEK